jgi:hypothetical protein
MSNYPPGVTGYEYEIAGAEAYYRGNRSVYCTDDDCPAFEILVDVDIDLESYDGNEWGTWECSVCARSYEYSGVQ